MTERIYERTSDTLLKPKEEIIRCKDCKHLQKWRSEESAKKFGQIYACARNVFNCPKPEDFCSHAEAYELGKADRPTGHWIDDDEQQILMKKFIEKGENWKVCNICGAGMRVGAKYDTDEQYRDFFHNYCPYCGARMESGEE